MSFSTLDPLTLPEWEAYCRNARCYHGTPRATCLHHCWKPTLATWYGYSSMVGIRRTHMTARGWSDIGANAYCDGTHVWTARPWDTPNWAHGLVEKSWSSVPQAVRDFCKGDSLALNKWAPGIEMVGNFDSENPVGHPVVEQAVQMFAMMHRIWDIPLERLFFHNMVAVKSCPGKRIDYDWFRGRVGAALGAPVADPKRVAVFDVANEEVSGRFWLGEDGATYGPLRSSVEAVGGKLAILEWSGARKAVRISPGGN